MSSIKTNFTVGIFVLIGFAIAFFAILHLGLSTKKGQLYDTYFDESVQGLSKDSAVKYRGVDIGRVDSIEVASDNTMIKVVLKIEDPDWKPKANMVAQLKGVGITGIMFIELDKKQPQDRIYSIESIPQHEHQVILAKPSDIKELFDSINDVLKTLKDFKLAEMMNKLSADLSTSLEVWNKAVSSVGDAADSFTTLTQDANHAVAALNGLIEKNEDEFSGAIVNLNSSMHKASNILEQGSELIKDADSDLYKLMQYLLVSMQNIEKATENLNRSMEMISDQPAQLIFGEPPPARKIEPER